MPTTREGYAEARRSAYAPEAQLELLRSPDIARLFAADRRERDLLAHRDALLDRVSELAAAGKRGHPNNHAERANVDRALAGVAAELCAVQMLRVRLIAEVGSLESIRDRRQVLARDLERARSHRDHLVTGLAACELAAAPAWLERALGERPTVARQSQLWDRAARGLARHRLENNIVDEHNVLGERPSDPAGAQRYDAVQERLDKVCRTLGATRSEIERPNADALIRGYAGLLGEDRAARLRAALDSQLGLVQTLSEPEVQELAARERDAVDQLDRRAAGHALRMEQERQHHVGAGEKQASAAADLERRASELGWRARHERQRLDRDAALQREHASRHQADADRIDLELARLREAGRHPDQWLDRCGEQLVEGIAACSELAYRKQTEVERRVQLASLDPPAYVIDLIGDPPTSGVRLAGEWEELAERIERQQLAVGQSYGCGLGGADQVAGGRDPVRDDSDDGRQLAVSIARFRTERGLPKHELLDDMARDLDRDVSPGRGL